MIPPRDVRLLVSDDVPCGFRIGIRRQVYPRTEHTEYEGRGDAVAYAGAVGGGDRFSHPKMYGDAARSHIYQHDRYADEPYYRRRVCNDLHRIGTVFGMRRKPRRQNGIHCRIDERQPRIKRGHRRRGDIDRHRLGGRQQAQSALDRKRAHKANADERPHDDEQRARGFAEYKAHRRHGKDHPSRSKAHV